MGPPCRHVPPQPQCGLCHVYATSEKYRVFFDAMPSDTRGSERAKSSKQPPAPCTKRGAATDETVECQTCVSAAVDLASDAAVPTPRALVEQIRKAGDTLAKERLSGTRRAVSDELLTIMKLPDAPLNPEVRKASAELFKRLGSILNELGGK